MMKLAMPVNLFAYFTLIVLVATSNLLAQDADKRRAKPNVILIYADDISAREFPMYESSVWTDPYSKTSDDPQYRAQTPVMNRLAREGVCVKTAWAATVCSPSRAMMMTGRYAHLHKWWHNGDTGKVTTDDGKKMTWPLYQSSPLLIGHVAQQAGYGTYWAGKTQMAGDLTQFGFDEGCFTPGNLEHADNPYTDFRMYEKKIYGKTVLFNADTDTEIGTYKQNGWHWNPHVQLMNHPSAPGAMCWWPNTPESKTSFGINTYGPDVELDFIFDYIDRQHVKEKPFFVYHTTHLGHDAFDWFSPNSKNKWPGTPIVKWDGNKYTRTEPAVTGNNGIYNTHDSITGPGIHNHINYIDYQVSLYLDKLEELGIADNTILIVTADNGTSGYGKASPDRQRGTHVPFIVYAPGFNLTKSGMQDVLVNMSDLLPTLAEIVSTEIPADYEINGKSLWPWLTTDQVQHRDWIYAYKSDMQLIRGSKVMKDGYNKWWDVSRYPDDLISFNQITDWEMVSKGHRSQRDQLKKAIEPFDKYDSERDAPGFASNTKR